MRRTKTENILHEYKGGEKGTFRLIASHHQRTTTLIDVNFMHASLICSQILFDWLSDRNRFGGSVLFLFQFQKKLFVPSGSWVTAGPDSQGKPEV